MTFKIATWNVNSLRVRLPQVLEWLVHNKPDVLCLQETKVQDENFPELEIRQAGYEVVFSGQKTFNGMAILSRFAGNNKLTEVTDLHDPQRRILVLTVGDIRIINLYIPNGESIDSLKYVYKLDWLAKVSAFIEAELKAHPKTIIVGDFNIAPEDRDVHDPVKWHDQIFCSEPERTAFFKIISFGLSDCFRLKDQPEKSFTWWDYRLNGFKRNLGLRIDHILASKPLANKCSLCAIDRDMRALERPSDHAPVLAEFNI